MGARTCLWGGSGYTGDDTWLYMSADRQYWWAQVGGGNGRQGEAGEERGLHPPFLPGPRQLTPA